MIHPPGKQSLTSEQVCAAQEAVGPSPYPDGSLVLCCSSHARPSPVVSAHPRQNEGLGCAKNLRNTMMSHIDKSLRTLKTRV